MTWVLQKAPRQTFRRNSLAVVILQLRFHPILKVAERIPDFHDSGRTGVVGVDGSRSTVMIVADFMVTGFLELGTAAPSPTRRDRWLTHVGCMTSETPLPEHFATYTDQTTTWVPSGTSVAEDLLEGHTFAQIVAQVMPVHEDLDRRAGSALRKRAAGQRPRKLSQK